MRIGIFIFGQLRRTDEDIRTLCATLKDALPTAEFCYATWKDELEERKELLDSLEGDVELFDQFDLHYRPYLDNEGVYDNYQWLKKFNKPNWPRHPHQTKQIVLHNELMKKHGHRFDVIVRTRFDCMVSPVVNIEDMCKEVYNEPCMTSCMARSTLESSILGIWYKCVGWIDPYMPYKSDNADGSHRYWMYNPTQSMMVNDTGLIIHRVEDWDTDYCDRLHNDCKLLAGEFGWHQMLIQNTSHGKWIHYDGGATLTRCLPKGELDKIKTIMGII